MVGDKSTEDGEKGGEPAAITRSVRVRATYIAEVVDRLASFESWIAEGLTPRQCVVRATKPTPTGYGMARSTAQKYVSAALHRLHQDMTREPIESKRARSLAFWYAQIDRALNAKKTWTQNGETIEIDAPDLKAAGQAREMLDLLEGLAR